MPNLDMFSASALAHTLQDRTDAEVLALCNDVGIDPLLDAMQASLVQRFLPERAPAGVASVQWNLQTPVGLRPFSLKVTAKQCSVERGTDRAARVVLTTTLPLFLRMIAGRLNGLQAFSDGALAVTGDLVLALEHQMWFDVDLSEAKLTISTPSELARLLSGRSEAEVEAGIALTGADAALDQVFRGMAENYLPRKGPKKRTIVEFSVRTREGDRVYQFVADAERCSFHRGSLEKPAVTLMLRFTTFLNIAAGKLDALIALAQGKIKLRGNILLARNVAGWFDLEA